MKRILACLLMVVMAASLTVGCSSGFLSKKNDGPTAVAYVGSEKLPVYEYEMKYMMTAAGFTKEEALDNMVNLKVQILKAQELGVVLTDEEKEQIKSYKDQLIASMGKEVYDSQLAMMGLTSDQFDALSELYELVSKLNQHIVQDANSFAVTTDEECKVFYDDKYLRAKHILFQTVDETGNPLAVDKLAEVNKKAQDTVDQIKNGTPFEDLASLSEDPGSETAPDGYLFVNTEGMSDDEKGYMSQSRLTMVSEFEKGTLDLDIGEVSDIVESSFGYHIIKRLDINEKPELFEEQKDIIKLYLNASKYEELVKTWKTEYKVKEDKKAIEAMIASIEEAQATPAQ